MDPSVGPQPMHAETARNPFLQPVLSKLRPMGNKRSLGAVLVAATTFAPFHASAQVNPSFSNVVNQPLSSSLRWGGGTGIFLLQKKYGLSDPAWINVLTTLLNEGFTCAPPWNGA